jgi:aldehyde:ferredoxin oxidoreductase
MHELVLAAQRTLNLARLFNLREGFKASDDWLPDRFFEPQTSGALSKTAVDKAELSAAIKGYYGMMGWSEEGVPRLETLQSLGIGWAHAKM